MNITIDKEVLEQVLEALNSYHGYMEPLTTIFGGPRVPAERSTTSKVEQAITAIREALAEQPAPVAEPHKQQEPVAWKDRTYGNLHHQDFGNSIPLYTSPPASKPWVGLTDEQIHKMTVLMGINPEWKAEMEIVRSVVRNLEAKLRERNEHREKNA